MKKIFLRLKEFLQKNESKVVLFVGFLLVSAISFEAGTLQGQKWQQEPLIVEKGVLESKELKTVEKGHFETSEGVSNAQKDATISKIDVPQTQTVIDGKCPYVGSKNSEKFYLASCSWAKRIKPENLVCFQTAEQALAKGRTESKCK